MEPQITNQERRSLHVRLGWRGRPVPGGPSSVPPVSPTPAFQWPLRHVSKLTSLWSNPEKSAPQPAGAELRRKPQGPAVEGTAAKGRDVDGEPL